MITCPFCHSQAEQKLENVFLFYQCKTCKAVFRQDVTKPILDYRENYYGSQQRKFNVPFYVFLKNVLHRCRWHRVRQYIDDGDYIVDVGCGHADWLDFLRQKKQIYAIGIELQGFLEKHLSEKKWLQLVTIPFQEWHFPQGQIKGIFFLHSFEHMSDPVEVLEKALSLLAPKGIIYIAIPNIHSWQFRLLSKHWLHLDPVYHLHFVSYKWLNLFFESRGLQHVQFFHCNFLYSFTGWIFSVLNFVAPYNRIWELLKSKVQFKHFGFYLLLFLVGLMLLLPAMILYIAECLAKRGSTIEVLYVKK